MKTTNQAVETARQFDRLYVQVMLERRKQNPDYRRIAELKRDGAKLSKRLRRLMNW